jgi:hypothetical protein
VHIGTTGTQVPYSWVSRAVSVLRVRQRRREHVPYAFRSRALDRAKRKWRVRVQSLDLISCECSYFVILPRNPCIRLGRGSLIPIAFGRSSTLVRCNRTLATTTPRLQTVFKPYESHMRYMKVGQAARLKIMRSAVRTREELRNAASSVG